MSLGALIGVCDTTRVTREEKIITPLSVIMRIALQTPVSIPNNFCCADCYSALPGFAQLSKEESDSLQDVIQNSYSFVAFMNCTKIVVLDSFL